MFETKFMNDNYVEKLARDIMHDFDQDGNASIDPNEFLSLIHPTDIYLRMTINFWEWEDMVLEHV